MPHPHLDHVREHLERVRYGHLVDPPPETVYLGMGDADSFWELIGVRFTGCPLVVLALLRFQSLELPGIPYSRESLATHLSTLPAPGAAGELGALSAILPPHDQGIPHFLRRLQAGLRVGWVSLDPARIELAFDFRLQSPTLLATLRDGAPPLVDHYYRTVDGHVLRGRSHDIPATAPDHDHAFVSISSPEQITARGVYPLPTLFLNRSYLALRARGETEEATLALRNWTPFVPEAANPGSLLPIPKPTTSGRRSVGAST